MLILLAGLICLSAVLFFVNFITLLKKMKADQNITRQITLGVFFLVVSIILFLLFAMLLNE